MRKLLKIFWVGFFVFLLAACSKNSAAPDNQTPVIQLSSPASNQVFTGGQTVNVAGNITDNGTLVEIHVHIYNNSTGQLLIDINRFPNTSTYALNESFQVQAGIQYKIQVLATDKGANQGVVTVLVSAN